LLDEFLEEKGSLCEGMDYIKMNFVRSCSK